MKNAVEGLDPSLMLSATLRVSEKSAISDDPVVYISRPALVSPQDLSAEKSTAQRTILDVHAEAANQLYLQRQTSRRLRQKKAGLQRFLERTGADEWEHLRTMQKETGSAAAIRYYATRDMRQPETAAAIQAYLADSPSYEEMRSNISAELASLEKEAIETENVALNHKIATITGEVTKVPNYARKLLGRIADLKVLHLRERRKEIGADEARKLLDLKVSRGGPDVLRGIQDIVKSLLGVRVDAFAPERSGPRAGLPADGAELDVDDFLVEANGAGIREALRIVLDFEFEHPQVLLIQEPEIHLHPGLETSMLSYLRRVSETCQVFITTHSTNFLESSDVGNIYI
jgi:putative ATP-dependent endonuclease of the OLD family